MGKVNLTYLLEIIKNFTASKKIVQSNVFNFGMVWQVIAYFLFGEFSIEFEGIYIIDDQGMLHIKKSSIIIIGLLVLLKSVLVNCAAATPVYFLKMNITMI